jgi:GT2 family glycosyltransferase
MEDRETVAAVVVTYNRKQLLMECLNSLITQTWLPAAVFIIDNASTDGTEALLYEKKFISSKPEESEKDNGIFETAKTKSGVKIYYVRLSKNTGGSGGFYEGIKRAYKSGYDWMWLMDDDTLPSNNALFGLFSISESFEEEPGFICSKVLWKDQSIHLMNIPQINTFAKEALPFNKYDKYPLVQGCSFVSVAVSREAVKKCGLPYKEFFIWGDDIEYTSRIVNSGFIGIYNPTSVVYHNTPENYCVSIFDDVPKNAWKYYYGIRNSMFCIKKAGLKGYFLSFIKRITVLSLKILFKRKQARFKYFCVNFKASMASLFFNPKEDKL